MPRVQHFPVGHLWFAPLSQNQLFTAPVFPGAVLLSVPLVVKLPADSPQLAAQKGCLACNPVKYVMKFLSLTVQ